MGHNEDENQQKLGSDEPAAPDSPPETPADSKPKSQKSKDAKEPISMAEFLSNLRKPDIIRRGFRSWMRTRKKELKPKSQKDWESLLSEFLGEKTSDIERASVKAHSDELVAQEEKIRKRDGQKPREKRNKR